MAASVSNAFSDLFYGNPFSTPVGSLIEESTESFVGPELWQLFTQVCEAVNHSVTGPKDAVRAIRRRFVTSVTSNETVAMHSLLLLETCVRNCGYRFHVAFATRDNLRDFAKFAVPDAEGVPEPIKHKLLSLIQDWSSEFGTQVDFQEFRNVYTELRARGVLFPSPTQTRSHTESNSPLKLPPENKLQASPPSQLASTVGHTDGETGSLPTQNVIPSSLSTPTHKTPKLDTDLAQVRVNICVLSDLVSEAEASESPADVETRQLMSEIAASLQEMSTRLIQAISCWEAYQETLPHRGTTDAVLLDMINVNDELHTVLLRYSRAVGAKDALNSHAQNGGGADVPMLTSLSTVQANTDALPQNTNGSSALGVDSNAEFDLFVGDRPSGTPRTSPTAEQDEADEVPLLAPSTERQSGDTAKDLSLIDF
ncbi:E3 ubiquitin-protein ligase tom1, variant 2 [Clonorchis sinensis]|uniref:E3 ubiquitin-protein ligase tom1, variant 2 n=1 Tax=Clonorchis sinensis TaxID=79923 RepID=A0A8T1M0G4_CLOSI|nr:E3 ubiquitin-protein ligase tom1, variant 2 [Clonorchis sinensis]